MASTLVIGVAIARQTVTPRAIAGMYAVLAVALAAISWPVPGIPSVVGTLRAHGPRTRATVLALHAEFLSAGDRYLSTDPIVPVLNGERPLLVDAFNLERFVREGSAADRDVDEQIRRRAFRAIIIRDTDDFPRDMNAGDPGFADACRKYWAAEHGELAQLFSSAYEVRAVRKPLVVLLPAPD